MQTRTPRVKLVPPRRPERFLPRQALNSRLDEAAAHRLTAVVAAAGFGKSMQLAANALANDWCWYAVDASDSAAPVLAQGLADALRRRLPELEDVVVPQATAADDAGVPDSLAAALARAIEDCLSEDLVLVVDDVHEIGRDAPGVRVLEALVRFGPPELHILLSSRDEVPFSVARLRAQSNVLDLDGSDLAFSSDEVAAVLESLLGTAEFAAALHEVTAGWPVAVQLGAEVLGSVDPGERWDVVAALAARDTPLVAYLAEEIFGNEPPEVRRLLAAIAQFDRVEPGLCGALGFEDADAVLADLARRGLLSEAGGSFAPHALIRQFVATAWPLSASEIRALRQKAGAWFESQHDAFSATRAFTAAGDHRSLLRVWESSWADLDTGAAVETILEAAPILPPADREKWGMLFAHALIIRGDIDEARRWLEPLKGKTPQVFFLEGLAHMHRSEHREALDKMLQAREAYRGEIDPYCPAFAAYQLRALGRIDEARQFAAEARSHARERGELAECDLLDSDLALQDGELTAALAAAENGCREYSELRNVLGECSARNRVAMIRSLLGRHDEALEAATAATRASERIGFSHFQAWTGFVRGFVSLRAGLLDEAMVDFASAEAIHERLATSGAADPLIGSAEIHSFRGERAQARSDYERALAAAERVGDASGRAQASAGLARLLADESPTDAIESAEAAVHTAPGVPIRIEALLAKGWVAQRVGNGESARSCAEEAETLARRTGSASFLASAIELLAFVDGAAERRVELLHEAAGIRRRLGERPAEAGTILALASVDATAVTPEERLRAEGTLRDLGIQPSRAPAGLLAASTGGVRRMLAVETLGRFAVVRDGSVVTPSEWQSRKARDLLKILITRRGQATTRDYLIEQLWPEDDPARTPARLAVALNVLRNVLDPERVHSSEHFVAGGSEGLRLELGELHVDAEEFLTRAGEALHSFAEGEPDAVAALEAAEAAYAGEFLPEDRYSDWATPLREEIRAAYQEVVRALAAAADDAAAAVRYLLRVLALDEYDEDAHLRLIATLSRAGLHGDARRAYRRYVEAMREIGVEPAAYEHAPDAPLDDA
jgi:ATP/maltotriose-dependent transcriptional regulator MalT/DNA-binding SARP family transcriptional activator